MNKRQRKKHLKKLKNKVGFSFESSLGYHYSKWQIQAIKLIHKRISTIDVCEVYKDLSVYGEAILRVEEDDVLGIKFTREQRHEDT